MLSCICLHGIEPCKHKRTPPGAIQSRHCGKTQMHLHGLNDCMRVRGFFCGNTTFLQATEGRVKGCIAAPCFRPTYVAYCPCDYRVGKVMSGAPLLSLHQSAGAFCVSSRVVQQQLPNFLLRYHQHRHWHMDTKSACLQAMTHLVNLARVCSKFFSVPCGKCSICTRERSRSELLLTVQTASC